VQMFKDRGLENENSLVHNGISRSRTRFSNDFQLQGTGDSTHRT
jgi:hypothetical protein